MCALFHGFTLFIYWLLISRFNKYSLFTRVFEFTWQCYFRYFKNYLIRKIFKQKVYKKSTAYSLHVRHPHSQIILGWNNESFRLASTARIPRKHPHEKLIIFSKVHYFAFFLLNVKFRTRNHNISCVTHPKMLFFILYVCISWSKKQIKKQLASSPRLCYLLTVKFQ